MSPHLRRPLASGPVAGRACALAVFRLRPPGRLSHHHKPRAFARGFRNASSASVRAPARSGHAPPLRLLGAGVPLPGSSRRATWPADASGTLAAPVAPAGGAPGVPALRGVAPARGCRGVSAARTHLPFFRRAPRRMAFGFVRRGRSAAISPSGSDDPRAKLRRPPLRPRLLGFVPAGGPSRVALIRAARPLPPWAFASLRCSDAGPGHAPESIHFRDGYRPRFRGDAIASRLLRFVCVSGRSWVFRRSLAEMDRLRRPRRPFSDTRTLRRLARPAFDGGRGSLCEVSHRLVVLAPTPPGGPDVLCARRQSGVCSSSEVLGRHEPLRRTT